MEPEEEEAVDLTSPDFDPAKALSSQAVSLPVPNVRPFENLAQYESAMKGLRARRKAPARAQHGGPESGGKSGGSKSKDSSTEAGPSARSLPPLVATHRKPAKTLLTRMKEAKQGPLDVLRSCISEKRRVIVTTRTFKGLRGICTGYLVAFDKFWNLAMADVEEVYHKPPLGKKFFNEETLTVSKLLQSETTSQIVSKKDYLMQSTRMKEEEGQKSSAAARTEQDTRCCSTQYKGQGAGMDLKSNVKKEPGDRGSGKARSSTRTELHHRNDYKESKEKRHTEEQMTDRRTSSKDSSLKRHGREKDKCSKAGRESLSTLESKLTNLQKELAALDAEESDEEEDTVQSTTGDTEAQGITSSCSTGTKAKTRRKPRKQECQFFKRHVNQLFVRGENVVIVSIKDA